ncbi:MAG: DUF1385 domain-containing protein [Clostridia bacterium]|nr:DUF1385 domain-containing protein [Clostridia bacterium]
MEKKQHITSIGGQAVLEGVMMRGPFKTATAVRKPDGDIECKVDENSVKSRNKFFKLPVIRGVFNFVDSLVIGMKALMYSAEFVDLEEEEEVPESKFDKWLNDKFSDKVKDIVIYVSIFLSIILSVGLFILLPTVITNGLEWLFSMTALSDIAETRAFTSICEGIVRFAIFLSYLALVSKMKDIKRVFEYHGAEHKTIACYESGEELTVENVKKYTRLHPRCGTSFLLFVMIISILVFALLPKTGLLLRIGLRLLLLPVVAGLSYEVIKLAGRSKSCAVGWLTKPGLWLQYLTTREPDDSQIEVAIRSMTAVIPENSEDDKW